MTQPTAPLATAPAAAPVPAAEAPPAPSTQGMTPASKPRNIVKRLDGSHQKSYTTKAPPGPPPPKVPPQAAAPAPSAPDTAGVAASGGAATVSAPPGPSPTTPAPPESIPVSSGGAETATPAEKPISAEEHSRRMAQIERGKRLLLEREKGIADREAQLQGHIQRAQVLEQSAQHIRNPQAFFKILNAVYGLTPQEIGAMVGSQALALQHAIDRGLTDGKLTPEQRQAQERQEEQQRIASLEKQVQDSAKAQREQEQQAQVAQYKRQYVAPLYEPEASFPYTKTVCRVRGEDPVSVIFDDLVTRTRQGRPADPQKSAAKLEALCKAQLSQSKVQLGHELHGTSVSPKDSPAPKPPPSTAAPPTRPPARRGPPGAYAPTPKSFTVRSVTK